jgi:hypothetical protein
MKGVLKQSLRDSFKTPGGLRVSNPRQRAKEKGPDWLRQIGPFLP